MRIQLLDVFLLLFFLQVEELLLRHERFLNFLLVFLDIVELLRGVDHWFEGVSALNYIRNLAIWKDWNFWNLAWDLSCYLF